MKKLILIFVLSLAFSFKSHADDIRFEASAPDVVVLGSQFKLTFKINTQDVKNLRVPTIENFDVLMGPSSSFQTTRRIVNGSLSAASSITYTYILMPKKEGKFILPAATIDVNGESLSSNSVQIEVLPADKTQGNGVGSGTSNSNNRSSQSSLMNNGKISDKDLFITATVNKTTVFEQEAILLTHKIYTTVNLTGLTGKMPDLKGFYTQEVELPRSKSYSLEHYNGRNYKTMIWSQYVLFPQQEGKIEIPSIAYDGVVTQQVYSADPFEAFFNGGSNYVEISRKIHTPKVVIEVKPLPSGKPANFSGAVGVFNLESSINTTELKTNEAITVKLVLSGTGNMKLISTPEVVFPNDVEIYDPKVDNKFSLTSNGLSGNKVFEYLAIPRHAGTFTIPPVEFSYFDIKDRSYKTLKTQEYVLNVEKGKGEANPVLADYTNKEDLKILGKDIRFIKIDDVALHKKNSFFFASWGYYLCYIIPLCILLVVVFVYRKQAIESANIVKVRIKKANKIATKRMGYAHKLLSNNKKNEFYDEVLKTLWGYISDKLSIPVSQLSKDNIELELTKCGIPEELINRFMMILNECEFARYAPGDDNKAMDKVYSSAVEIISKMENQIKR